jgi:hypothetical protein
MTSYSSMPPEPPQSPRPDERPIAPSELRPVVRLLLVNLTLSILLTMLVFAFRHSVIDYQVAHTHISRSSDLTPDQQRAAIRSGANAAIWGRAAGNIVVAVAYFFLIRGLWWGRRRSYRRVLLLSIAGPASLILLWVRPYPAWMRAEQVMQALVLLCILYFVTRPKVRAHFVKR